MATDFTSKKISEIYSEGISAEELSLKPVNLELVGDVKDKDILDLGCGNGRYSILFAERGARVKAIDVSPYQIEIAKKINLHPNIEYTIGDVSTLHDIRNNSADIVFMNLVIPDLEKKEMLENIMSETKRVLKKNGRFIFSTLHPLYLSPEQDPLDKAMNFKKENYFKEGSNYNAEAATNAGNKITFNETHFSLSYISKVLRENGFFIKSIVESKNIPEKGIYLPKYLVFECVPAKI